MLQQSARAVVDGAQKWLICLQPRAARHGSLHMTLPEGLVLEMKVGAPFAEVAAAASAWCMRVAFCLRGSSCVAAGVAGRGGGCVPLEVAGGGGLVGGSDAGGRTTRGRPPPPQ